MMTKYDSDGNLLWTRELCVTEGVFTTSVAIGANGLVYVAGSDGGGGRTSYVGFADKDALLAIYSSDGDLLLTYQYGTRRPEWIGEQGLAVDGQGNAYLGGRQIVARDSRYSDSLLMKVAILAGDFTGDGAVDGVDLLAWQRGAAYASYSAADLRAWESQFGSPAPPPPAGAVVPEPAAALLVLATLATLVSRRRLPGHCAKARTGLRKVVGGNSMTRYGVQSTTC
jgi:hypothetical protein